MARAFLAGGLAAIVMNNIHRATAHSDLLQIIEDVLRHTFRQIDQAEAVANFDLANMLSVQTRFVGDGTDDIARHNTVVVADLDTKALFPFVRRRCRSTASPLTFIVVPPRVASLTGWLVLVGSH